MEAANSVIQEPQKNQELEDIDETSKSLGNLSDDVLLDILSLLPTKEAVRTSLLSKRWEYLWASMSNLVFDGSLPAKRTICFPNLKILTMKYVTFWDEDSIQQLLSAPPLLEKLELHNCSWGDLKVVTISAPNLQYLSIREIMRRSPSHGDVCQVMIFGESLKEFYYRGLFGHYCLYNSVSLKKAGIFTYPNPSVQIAHRMYKLLAGLSNVQFLELSSAVVKVCLLLSFVNAIFTTTFSGKNGKGNQLLKGKANVI
jgi:hypothetical protein